MTNLVKYITHVVVHECGHTLGLVPDGVDNGHAHDICICGYHIMDDGENFAHQIADQIPR